MPDSLLRRITRALFGIGVVLVALVSLTPQDALPPVALWDKLLHLLAYGALAVLGGVSFPGPRRMIVLGVWLLLLGAALEFAQGQIPGRFASLGDALANALGVVLGLAAVHWAARLRRG